MPGNVLICFRCVPTNSVNNSYDLGIMIFLFICGNLELIAVLTNLTLLVSSLANIGEKQKSGAYDSKA